MEFKMKDVSFEIRKQYYNALQQVAPTFDMIAPIGTTAPYIIIGNISESDESSKTDIANEVQVTVEVITEYSTAQNKGRKQGEEIMGLITQLIIPKLQSNSTTHQILSTRKISSRTLMDFTDTTVIYRKINVFKNLIKQL